MISNSQAFQDTFVSNLITENKTYIEIGGHEPIKWSNTYNLEMQGWKGFSIELNTDHQGSWAAHPERTNKIYWENALTFDYAKALSDNNLPMHVGYLSCDIEPPENTFAALQRVLSQGITFDCITYEHDNYASKKDWDIVATEYLKQFNYKPIVYDVYADNNTNKKFETWFVRNDSNLTLMSFDEWKQTI